MSGIENAYLKLRWAKGHLKRLDPFIAAFHASKPCAFVREDDVENQRHILRVKLHDVPPAISLTVGDAFYNMRSCLDQLVWGLGNRPGHSFSGKTYFPIISVDDADGMRRFEAQTKGVTPRHAIDVIESLQPYHRGASYEAHPLWRLNAMCVIDKHKRIPANGSEAKVYFPNASDLTDCVQTLDDWFVITVPISDKSKLELDPSFFFKINFGGDDTGLTEDLDGIWAIYNSIAYCVLPRFARFFP